MKQLLIVLIAVGAVALVYWALNTEFNKQSQKNLKPVRKAPRASRKPLTPHTRARIEAIAVELNKPRKTRSDKGKKRGTYKKGKK